MEDRPLECSIPDGHIKGNPGFQQSYVANKLTKVPGITSIQ